MTWLETQVYSKSNPEKGCDESFTFVSSSRKNVTFLEVLKKPFRKLAAPASHRIWNVTFCDENVTGVTSHSFLVNFVPVTHSKPLVGLLVGSGNIWARNERQSLVLPIERRKSDEIGVPNLKPKNFGKKASEDACGRALTLVRIAFTRIGGTGMSEQPGLATHIVIPLPPPYPCPHPYTQGVQNKIPCDAKRIHQCYASFVCLTWLIRVIVCRPYASV